MGKGFRGINAKLRMGHFYTSGFEIGTLLHNWEKQLGHFYTSGRSNQDTFTHLEETIRTLLHIWKKQSGHFYTSGKA
ncbi:hypothetical protein B5F71_07975 [Bacteroides sp. An269]|nr:hypothetical protein B5F71_07975 [Bacteroides sp. An269]